MQKKAPEAEVDRKAGCVIVTLNTHSFQEKENREEKLGWIATGLGKIEADIICLNEIVYGNIYAYGYAGTYYDTAEMIKTKLEIETGCKYFLYQEGFAKWEKGENLGNAILSRYPFLKTDKISLTTKTFWPAPHAQRMCLYAQIDLPKQGILDIFVTHAMGFDQPETKDQIAEIKQFVIAKSKNQSLGAIVMGDFNIPYGHKYYTPLIEEPPYFWDTYALSHPHEKATGTGFPENQRIDYIFWVDGIQKQGPMKLRSDIIFHGKEYDGHFYPIVSDHLGVVTKFFFQPSDKALIESRK